MKKNKYVAVELDEILHSRVNWLMTNKEDRKLTEFMISNIVELTNND